MSKKYYLAVYIGEHSSEAHLEAFTLKEALEEVNRDRSSEFIPYNKDDWKEGFTALTDYFYISEISSATYKYIRCQQKPITELHNICTDIDNKSLNIPNLLLTLSKYYNQVLKEANITVNNESEVNYYVNRK